MNKGNPALMAAVWNNMGDLYQRQLDFDQAVDSYQQALPLLETSGNRRFLARTLNNMGTVEQARGNLDGAIDFYRKALPALEDVKDADGQIITINNIAYVFNKQERYEEARQTYEEALTIAQGNHLVSIRKLLGCTKYAHRPIAPTRANCRLFYTSVSADSGASSTS